MSEAVEAVRRVLSLPDEALDYARAKIAFDRVIDPSIDEQWVLAELDRLTEAARSLAGSGAGTNAKLIALHKLIYESGPWNDHRPFGYDHANYRDIGSKLISRYLATRLGNCVSMPILFLILGTKLNLEVGLATAPMHLFLKYRVERGHLTEFEATRGFAVNEAWYRQAFPISDRAVKSGLYLRMLSTREGIAAMALTIVEHLMAKHRFEELIEVSQLILRCNPRCGTTLVNQGIAWEKIGRREFGRYASPFIIPVARRPLYHLLAARSEAAFAAAQALGCEPVQYDHSAGAVRRLSVSAGK